MSRRQRITGRAERPSPRNSAQLFGDTNKLVNVDVLPLRAEELVAKAGSDVFKFRVSQSVAILPEDAEAGTVEPGLISPRSPREFWRLCLACFRVDRALICLQTSCPCYTIPW